MNKLEEFYTKLNLLADIENTAIDKTVLINKYESAKASYMKKYGYDEFELYLIFHTIKNLHHKSFFEFDIEKLIAFICFKNNKNKFRGYFEECGKNYVETGTLIAKKFAHAQNLKSAYGDIVSIFTNPTQGVIDVYEHQIINFTSKNSFYVTEKLDKLSLEGWNLITTVGNSFIFRRKLNKN